MNVPVSGTFTTACEQGAPCPGREQIPRHLSDMALLGAREGAHRAWRDLRERADEAERRYLDLVLEQRRRESATAREQMS